jgi:cell division protein FtsL
MQRSSKRLGFTLLIVTGAATLLVAQSFPSSKTSAKRKGAAARAVPQEIQDLRDLIAVQQQQLQAQHQQVEELKSQMQQLLDATRKANAAADKGQSSAEQAQTTAAQAQAAAADAQRAATEAGSRAGEAKIAVSTVTAQTKDAGKRLSALQDLVGRFRFSGDVRIRGEDFFQDGVPTRNRVRVRVRFGVEGQLSEDFTGGLALASGTVGDPTTTNETLTNFFDRKTIGLDRGYVTYNPVAARWLSLTGGKFAYTWQRTSLTLDPDINPEGFDEKFSFDLHTPLIKNVTVQGMQLLYNEVTRGDDSFAIGGQASGVIKLGPWTSTPSFTLLDWRFPDALLAASAFATQATTSGTPAIPIPGEGPGCATGFGLATVPPCAIAANGMTNATYTDSKGVRHFLAGFEYADLIVNNQIKTGLKRFPANFIVEYEDNLGDSRHPLNATGVPISSLKPQRKAYMGDFSVGQAKTKGDLQFGYSWWRLEQDAIISSWAESDQRAPTNVLQNRLYATWKPQQHVLAQYTLWFGRTLNSSLEHAILATGVAPGQTEPDLKRQQFDLTYIF